MRPIIAIISSVGGVRRPVEITLRIAHCESKLPPNAGSGSSETDSFMAKDEHPPEVVDAMFLHGLIGRPSPEFATSSNPRHPPQGKPT